MTVADDKIASAHKAATSSKERVCDMCVGNDYKCCTRTTNSLSL